MTYESMPDGRPVSNLKGFGCFLALCGAVSLVMGACAAQCSAMKMASLARDVEKSAFLNPPRRPSDSQAGIPEPTPSPRPAPVNVAPVVPPPVPTGPAPVFTPSQTEPWPKSSLPSVKVVPRTRTEQQPEPPPTPEKPQPPPPNFRARLDDLLGPFPYDRQYAESVYVKNVSGAPIELYVHTAQGSWDKRTFRPNALVYLSSTDRLTIAYELPGKGYKALAGAVVYHQPYTIGVPVDVMKESAPLLEIDRESEELLTAVQKPNPLRR